MEQKKIKKLLNVIYEGQYYVKAKNPDYIDKYVGYSEILKSPFTSTLLVEIECNGDGDYITISIILPLLGFAKSINYHFAYEDESSVLGRKLLEILRGCEIPGHILEMRLDDYILCIKYGKEL